jgi:multidrug resistance efflux pump
MRWKIVYTLFLVALVCIILTGRRNTSAKKTTIVPVRSLQRGIFAPGRVEGNSAEIELYASIREVVTAIPVSEGEFVRMGDIIVQLDDRIYAAEVELAEAGVHLAKAELDRLRNGQRQSEIDEARQQCELRNAELILANRVYERGLKLAQTGSISQYELDQNESNAASSLAMFQSANARLATIAAPARIEDLSIAEARYASAQAKLRIAKAALAKTIIVAPRDGVVLKINVEVGELQTDKPWVVMSDTEALYVRASVDEFDALRVFVGQAVTMTTNAIPERIFFGKIARISPRMDHKEIVTERLDAKMDTRAREILVEVEKDSPLIVGLPMELWIGESQEQIDAHSSPRTAALKR